MSGPATALINVQATNSGTFLVVLSDLSSYYAGSGTYRLTVNGLSAGLKQCIPLLTGTNYNLSAIGGSPGSNYVLYTQTNVAAPLSAWAPFYTNIFDPYGVFSLPNPYNRFDAQRYFMLDGASCAHPNRTRIVRGRDSFSLRRDLLCWAVYTR